MSDELAALEALILELTRKISIMDLRIAELEDVQKPKWNRDDTVLEPSLFSGL